MSYSSPQKPISKPYVGRFAPSPTGPLHFGSLVCAVGSYLQARAQNGRWLLRIDDLDQPRVVKGSAEKIVNTLGAYGFEWDGEITYQSQQRERYAKAIELLKTQDKIYVCTCSRAQIALQNSQVTQRAFESDEPRYLGTCRNLGHSELEAHSLRFRTASTSVNFADALQGLTSQDVESICGDFVVRRRDGLHAYHLAVVLDDFASDITEVVRGADLLSSTPRQILLQRALEIPTPKYCHLPLAIDSAGLKLSKSAQSIAISNSNASQALWQALQFLRQRPPLELRTAPLDEIWNWSIRAWNLSPLIGVAQDLAPIAVPNY